jgi:DNA invertase Pin-like site-specific DNA recombinase
MMDVHDTAIDKEGGSQIRAAKYVRMSTEHQRYSTENQGDAIQAYAARHGYTIVCTYADQGKSGLSIDGRDGLRRLLADVVGGAADYSVVLVYDVSRWGRFQDADESAFYEYQCKRAGVRVEYCVESFENDGSFGSDIHKMLKRKMAGEYSRELSVKVFAGQCRLIELGFRQGGPAGFGLRRQLIDERGFPKAELARSEHKSLQTDRVILVPGPPNELEVVRRIYRSFVEEARKETEIAALLNADGLYTDLGRPWTRGTVHQVLVNEKYIGNNVWNRGSFKLRQKRVRNGPEMWIRADGAFTPVVDRLLFEAAQDIIRARSVRLTDAEMLDSLRLVLSRHGYLSGIVIDETEDCPSSTAFRSRFGSLLRTYALIGYRPPRDFSYVEINRYLRQQHPLVVAETIGKLRSADARVEVDPASDRLLINDEFTASLILSRCQRSRAGGQRWLIRLEEGRAPDITVVVRMTPNGETAHDYYLLPSLDLTGSRLRLAERNEAGLDAYRFDTLDALVDLARRVPLKEVA